MRLWSLAPRYLDQQGLNRLWREAIRAKNALKQGEENEYYNHPQLDRFKEQPHALTYIQLYLKAVYEESVERDFNFNEKAFGKTFIDRKLSVTNGQLDFEEARLKDKLEERGSIEEHNNLTVGAGF